MTFDWINRGNQPKIFVMEPESPPPPKKKRENKKEIEKD